MSLFTTSEVGVATSSPIWILSVDNNWGVDGYGIVHYAGAHPTSSAGSVAGFDEAGYVYGLSSASSVTITFGAAQWTSYQSCAANASASGVRPYVTAISQTSVTFTFEAALTGTLYYLCGGK